ncbi:MAG: hypothetical protein JRC68_09215 [Deltaproteobacteria bacterium]|nr:hypothetical protein [Deltaproteobacteria bacterium]
MKIFKIVPVSTMLLFLALSFTYAGAETAKKDWKWPKRLIAASGGLTSPGYIVPISWTPIHQKDTGMKWRVLAEPASVTRFRLVKDRKIDFLYSNLQAGGDLLSGGEGLATRQDGPFQLRLALPGFKMFFGLEAFGRSGVKTLDDIRKRPGITYGVPIGIVGIVRVADAYRAFLGMDEKEMVTVPYGSYRGMTSAYLQGKFDLIGEDPTGMTVQRFSGTNKKGGVIFFDLPEDDIEGNKRFRQEVPKMSLGVCDIGVPEARGKRMLLFRWIAYANKELDSEIVYRLLKWHEESYDRFKDKCPLCPFITIKAFRDTLNVTYIPVHEGAIRYMKEKGMWSAADDIRHKYNIKVADIHIKAYQSAIARADAKKVEVVADSEEWQALWENYKKEKGIPVVGIMSDKEIADSFPNLK